MDGHSKDETSKKNSFNTRPSRKRVFAEVGHQNSRNPSEETTKFQCESVYKYPLDLRSPKKKFCKRLRLNDSSEGTSGSHTPSKVTSQAQLFAEGTSGSQIPSKGISHSQVSAEETSRSQMSLEGTSQSQISAEGTSKSQISVEETSRSQISLKGTSQSQISAEATSKSQIIPEGASQSQISAEGTSGSRISPENIPRSNLPEVNLSRTVNPSNSNVSLSNVFRRYPVRTNSRVSDIIDRNIVSRVTLRRNPENGHPRETNRDQSFRLSRCPLCGIELLSYALIFHRLLCH